MAKKQRSRPLQMKQQPLIAQLQPKLGQAEPTPQEIQYAQDNPTDGVLQAFEQKFGPGSTRQYLTSSTAIRAPKPLRRRRRPIAAGG